MTVLGSGEQTRSFLYVADLVNGLVALMESNYDRPFNIGNQAETSINDLAATIRDMVGTWSTSGLATMAFTRGQSQNQFDWTSGGSSGIIRFFPDLKCLLGRGGGGLKVLVRSIGNGKGVQELGVLILGDLAKAPSQCKCLGRASECFVRCGRQEQ